VRPAEGQRARNASSAPGAGLIFVGAGISTGTASPVQGPARTALTAGTIEQQEFQLLNLINQERARNGLQPVRMQVTFRNYARHHALDEANAGSIWHNMAEFQRWVPTGWTRLGENVAYNQSVTAMHQAYMNSPGHRQNILNPDFNYVGVAIVARGGRLYNSEDFMAHPNQNLPTINAPGTSPTPAPPAPRADPQPAPARDQPPTRRSVSDSVPTFDLTWWFGGR